MKRGFTLLELIVALGVFTIVVGTSTASLIILINAQRKTFFVQTNQDNIRFSLEVMAREIRTGILYRQSTDYKNSSVRPYCNNQDRFNPQRAVLQFERESCFQFINANNKDVVYKLAVTDTEKQACNPGLGKPPAVCILKSVENNPPPAPNARTFLPVTAPEVLIRNVKFLLTGEDPNDGYQPRVTIILSAATPGTNPLRSDLDVQTTVSQIKQDSE